MTVFGRVSLALGLAVALVLFAGAGMAATPMTPPWYEVAVDQVGVAKGGAAPITILILTDLGGAFSHRWFRADPQIRAEALDLGAAALSTGRRARVMLSDTSAGSPVARFYLTGVALGPPDPGSCAADAECGMGEYCARRPGDCLGRGVCAPRPELCPLVWLPVCGCDGTTYGNACEAARAGVSVAHEGTCR